MKTFTNWMEAKWQPGIQSNAPEMTPQQEEEDLNYWRKEIVQLLKYADSRLLTQIYNMLQEAHMNSPENTKTNLF